MEESERGVSGVNGRFDVHRRGGVQKGSSEGDDKQFREVLS